MAYKNSVITKILDEQTFKIQLSEMISILKNHSIYSVEILFGYAWGNFYKNWIPFEVDISSIDFEIGKAEQTKSGKFGADDFYITLNQAEVKILFCHENDIHLSFNIHHPLVNDIIEMWNEKRLLTVK